jgi:hypothetical protein
MRTCVICAALVGISAWLGYSALLTKSATLDEPLHTVSAFAALQLHDYRLDPENPPLWKYWAGIGIPNNALHIDPADPNWRECTRPDTGQVYTTRLLYQMPGIDGRQIVNSARGAMLVIAILVLIVASGWAYQLGGSAAAIATCILLGLDPTFLAHGAIVKNDIIMMLLLLALVIALWRTVGRMTLLNVLAIALVCGLAISAKFSGLLWPGIAAVVLIARALLPHAWSCCGRSLGIRRSRLFATIGAGVVTAIVSVATIWASYGFRYGVAPDPRVSIDVPLIVSDIRTLEMTSRLHHQPTPQELEAWSAPINVRLALFLNDHHLLPEAWNAGFLGVYREMLRHPNYLLGQVRQGRGWWYYFPLALVFKTPITTLVVLLGCAVVLVSRRVELSDKIKRALLIIAAACCIYMGSAMMQPINHGVRHLLPMMALLYVAAGVIVSRLMLASKKRRLAIAIGAVLTIALAVEVLPVYPNFIPFFNVACGGSRGGLALLGDSNLDWGQDLPLLAKWQQSHPDEKLYYCCYGTVDPAVYGIRYTNLAGGYVLGRKGEKLTTPGVIAISATRLQGLFMPEDLAKSYARLRTWPVRQVLGGSIYLYDFPPR